MFASNRARWAGAPAVDNLEQNLSVGGAEADDAAAAAAARLETPVYEKFDALLHAGMTSASAAGKNKRREVLAIAFVKKYLQYAKTRIRPQLTKGASEWIVGVYAGLRNDDLASNQKRVCRADGSLSMQVHANLDLCPSDFAIDGTHT